ncbi:MAG: energy transducer TonB [Bacteroidales bacterium]
MAEMGKDIDKAPAFDDLVFEKRNRKYGAYQLRKRYNGALSTGIILATVIFSAFILIPFLAVPEPQLVLGGGSGYVYANLDNLEPPREQQIYIPPAPPPPDVRSAREVVKYAPTVIVEEMVPAEQTLAIADDILLSDPDDDIDLEGFGYSDGYIPGLVGDGMGSGSDEPFFFVEVMPAFRGGDLNRFREWVQKRTNYPQQAIENRIQGRVFLTFIIEPDGSVSNVSVVKGVDPLIDVEAVKSIEASPKWSPGLQRGQPVRVRYSMWLNFVI